MLAWQRQDESGHSQLLGRIEEDPLSPRMKERVRCAVEARCPTAHIAGAVYLGLEGVLATYWVALQEGKLENDDAEFYKVVGMRRYVRACYYDRERLLRFLEVSPDFFEMLGRLTSWQH